MKPVAGTAFKTAIALAALALFALSCSSSGDRGGTGSAPTSPPAAAPAPAEDPASTEAPAPAEETPEAPVPAENEPGGEPEPPPPTVEPSIGVSDSEIVISVVRSDTADLQERGVIPDVGDPVENFKVFAGLANEAGGAAGREIVVTSHLYPPGATATAQQPACLQATEDDEAFIVVFVGGMAAETVLCVTEQHERIAYALSGVLTQSVYDRSGGRLFNHAVSANRLMNTWVQVLDDNGILSGATFGLIRHDQSDHAEAADVVRDALAERGYDLIEEIALPCEGTSCGQAGTAIERFQARGVDHIFSLMGAIQYTTVVSAAEAAGYRPQWLSSDFENQAFDSTAAFMRGISRNYEGAYGVSASPLSAAPDAYRSDCNTRFTQVTGIEYEPLVDAWNAVGSMCYIVDRIVEAADNAEAAGGLSQSSFIVELEKLTFELGDARGGWAPGKHDATDTYVLKQWSRDCLCWHEIEGSRGILNG
ncbi:ABC transporter substrate-binding protein [Candidatus Poriferisocius sp.]|uniref:ABC transporter substrate-binding protein n=1 Tax=Candidatus Poriferisocius sp. TaxID=3101276 RepID=UPI003B01A233